MRKPLAIAIGLVTANVAAKTALHGFRISSGSLDVLAYYAFERFSEAADFVFTPAFITAIEMVKEYRQWTAIDCSIRAPRMAWD